VGGEPTVSVGFEPEHGWWRRKTLGQQHSREVVDLERVYECDRIDPGAAEFFSQARLASLASLFRQHVVVS